jgi:hypothetical protein
MSLPGSDLERCASGSLSMAPSSTGQNLRSGRRLCQGKSRCTSSLSRETGRCRNSNVDVPTDYTIDLYLVQHAYATKSTKSRSLIRVTLAMHFRGHVTDSANRSSPEGPDLARAGVRQISGQHNLKCSAPPFSNGRHLGGALRSLPVWQED